MTTDLELATSARMATDGTPSDVQSASGMVGCVNYNRDQLIMSTLERAIAIAAAAHAGQVDKAGAPYILHPLRVMLGLSTLHERIAAVLHDVVEDSAVTLEDLRSEGFPDEVVTAIDALTKRPGETRRIAAARAALDPLARAVKLADNADNMDLSRISNPSEADYARLQEYRVVRAILLGEGS